MLDGLLCQMGSVYKPNNQGCCANNLGGRGGRLQPPKATPLDLHQEQMLIIMPSQEAEESYKKAIKQRKKYPDAYYNLGNLVSSYIAQSCTNPCSVLFQYKDLGQHTEAISAYEAAISLQRDHISAWNNYGLLYEELSEPLWTILQFKPWLVILMQKCMIKQKR